MEIRPGAEANLPAIVEILDHYVQNTHVTFDVDPVTVESRLPWFEQFGDGVHRLVVAVEGGDVVGYATTTPLRPKQAYHRSVEATVYVRDGLGGRGIGTALFGSLLPAAAAAGAHRAYGIVALPNPGSVALMLRFGFRSVGVLREVGYKFDRYWDTEWFEKDL